MSFTFLQRFVAELVYKAAMLPAKERGSIGDCAKALGLRVSELARALRELNVVRHGLLAAVRGPPEYVRDFYVRASGHEFSPEVLAEWARALER